MSPTVRIRKDTEEPRSAYLCFGELPGSARYWLEGKTS